MNVVQEAESSNLSTQTKKVPKTQRFRGFSIFGKWQKVV
jgi:hypothetical protein